MYLIFEIINQIIAIDVSTCHEDRRILSLRSSDSHCEKERRVLAWASSWLHLVPKCSMQAWVRSRNLNSVDYGILRSSDKWNIVYHWLQLLITLSVEHAAVEMLLMSSFYKVYTKNGWNSRFQESGITESHQTYFLLCCVGISNLILQDGMLQYCFNVQTCVRVSPLSVI